MLAIAAAALPSCHSQSCLELAYYPMLRLANALQMQPVCGTAFYHLESTIDESDANIDVRYDNASIQTYMNDINVENWAYLECMTLQWV